MKLIWKIFVRDVRQATRNVIAVIVAMGLVIVPALYLIVQHRRQLGPVRQHQGLEGRRGKRG